jgi:predicted RNase H-like HicB family nuclease
MNELIFLVEEDSEGGFNAKAVGVSIFTQGETVEELRANIRDAVECHYELVSEPK